MSDRSLGQERWPGSLPGEAGEEGSPPLPAGFSGRPDHPPPARTASYRSLRPAAPAAGTSSAGLSRPRRLCPDTNSATAGSAPGAPVEAKGRVAPPL